MLLDAKKEVAILHMVFYQARVMQTALYTGPLMSEMHACNPDFPYRKMTTYRLKVPTYFDICFLAAFLPDWRVACIALRTRKKNQTSKSSIESSRRFTMSSRSIIECSRGLSPPQKANGKD